MKRQIKVNGRFSQKLLEFIHKSVIDEIKPSRIELKYVSTSTWRKTLNLKATYADLKNNKKVNDAKKQHKSKKELGLKGKITAKHRSVRFVNEKFNLNLLIKDNDKADAIAVVLAYLQGASLSTGMVKRTRNEPK